MTGTRSLLLLYMLAQLTLDRHSFANCNVIVDVRSSHFLLVSACLVSVPFLFSLTYRRHEDTKELVSESLRFGQEHFQSHPDRS